MTHDSTEITLNAETQTFSIWKIEGDERKYQSTLGYQYVLKQAMALAKAMKQDDINLSEKDLGSVDSLKCYQKLLKLAVTYKPKLGTWFEPGTTSKVKRVLEKLRVEDRKEENLVRIFTGDPDTGRSDESDFEVLGYVGRSTGTLRVPLLVAPGAFGGGSISSSRVVRIQRVMTGEDLYIHKSWKPASNYSISDQGPKDYPWQAVDASGNVSARFQTRAYCADWIYFMEGNTSMAYALKLLESQGMWDEESFAA